MLVPLKRILLPFVATAAMPGIATRSLIHLVDNYANHGESDYNLLHRILAGSAIATTPGAPPTQLPSKRSLTVDGVEHEFSVSSDFWGGRESFKTSWNRMAKADMFITYFEIGNIKSAGQAQTMYNSFVDMHLTDKMWLHAIVGVNAGFTDVASTADMREWAKERNVDYFEVTVNDGPSVDEMLTELIRKARLLPERTAEDVEKVWNAMADARQKRMQQSVAQSKAATASNEKAAKAKSKLEAKAKSKQWQVSQQGWVPPTKSSAGCLVM